MFANYQKTFKSKLKMYPVLHNLLFTWPQNVITQNKLLFVLVWCAPGWRIQANLLYLPLVAQQVHGHGISLLSDVVPRPSCLAMVLLFVQLPNVHVQYMYILRKQKLKDQVTPKHITVFMSFDAELRDWHSTK